MKWKCYESDQGESDTFCQLIAAILTVHFQFEFHRHYLHIIYMRELLDFLWPLVIWSFVLTRHAQFLSSISLWRHRFIGCFYVCKVKNWFQTWKLIHRPFSERNRLSSSCFQQITKMEKEMGRKARILFSIFGQLTRSITRWRWVWKLKKENPHTILSQKGHNSWGSSDMHAHILSLEVF